jgi:hypothetical protein
MKLKEAKWSRIRKWNSHIWSKLTSFLLCCSTVRRQLRFILWVGTMWQYWTTRISPLLSTGRWQILMLFSSGTTILKNIYCSYVARVIVLPDFHICLQSSVVTIIGTNTNKSVQVHMSFGPSTVSLYMILVLQLTICCMVQVVEHWMFSNTFVNYCENFFWLWMYNVFIIHSS